MAYFHDRSDDELNSLTDEELITQMRSAREHGHPDAERRARQFLSLKVYDTVLKRVRLRMRRDPQSAVEDVADAVLDSLLESEVKGETIGEVKSFINTLMARRVADHQRRKRLRTTELAEEHADEDEPIGAVPFESDPTDAKLVELVADQVLTRRSALHQRVVVLNVFHRHSARETTAIVDEEFAGDPGIPMSEANVHQIAKRYRSDLRGELGGGS